MFSTILLRQVLDFASRTGINSIENRRTQSVALLIGWQKTRADPAHTYSCDRLTGLLQEVLTDSHKIVPPDMFSIMFGPTRQGQRKFMAFLAAQNDLSFRRDQNSLG